MALTIRLSRKKIIVLKHIIVWLVYMTASYLVNILADPKITLQKIFFVNLLLCGVFYAIVACLEYYFAKRKKYVLGVIMTLLLFFLLSSFTYFYVYRILPSIDVILSKPWESAHFNAFIQTTILAYVKFFIYAMLYFSIKQWIRKEKEKMGYEYAFLRAQINPHFLYNTLNTFYSQALPHSEELAHNITKLAKLMRYSMEGATYESGVVPIENEIAHLSALLDINRLRFGKNKHVVFEIEGRQQGQQLPPLSIITVVENAFKYGNLSDPLHPLTIKIKLGPQQIYFYCHNRKRPPGDLKEISSNGIGETNLGKRLDVVFKNRYTIHTRDEADSYTFEMTINN